MEWGRDDAAAGGRDGAETPRSTAPSVDTTAEVGR